jgi:protein gp37
MAEFSKIAWTDHTFNPWKGCSKVSPGCKNCYAETLSNSNHSSFGVWGPNGTRVVSINKNWNKCRGWDEQAEKENKRVKVFCASLCDIFEDWRKPMLDSKGNQILNEGKALSMSFFRAKTFALIENTPNIDWLVLTKRPENIKNMMDEIGFEIPSNVWLGASTENQKTAESRIPELLKIPAKVHFISCEPLLEDINVSKFFNQGLNWVIVGGESGEGARQFNIEWARNLKKQCEENKVAFFMKQLGANSLYAENEGDESKVKSLELIDRKGGDPEEWSEDIRVRQFPKI